jgi:hypothetical protein
VWISPGGATSFVAPFLRADATLILLPFCTRTACPQDTDPANCVCRGGFCCYVHEHYFHPYLRSSVLMYEVQVPEEMMGECVCVGYYKVRMLFCVWAQSNSVR